MTIYYHMAVVFQHAQPSLLALDHNHISIYCANHFCERDFVKKKFKKNLKKKKATHLQFFTQISKPIKKHIQITFLCVYLIVFFSHHKSNFTIFFVFIHTILFLSQKYNGSSINRLCTAVDRSLNR